MHQATFASPLGPIVVLAQDDEINALYIDSPAPDEAAEIHEHPALGRLGDQLERYWGGEPVVFDVPLKPRGTAFQMRVWQALQDIPYGKTISYGELARRIGQPTAVRAVGRAAGANPIPVVIPCHRVIGGRGSLVGYAGGLERKQTLLMLEGALAGAGAQSLEGSGVAQV